MASTLRFVRNNRTSFSKLHFSSTQYLITAKMRICLKDELFYSNDDIREMTPPFAAEVIKFKLSKKEDTKEEEMSFWREHFREFNCLPDSLDLKPPTADHSSGTTKES